MIIGFNKRTFSVKGQTKAEKCQKCSHERPFKVVLEKRWFTFFLVPIFVYKKRELLVCTVCGAGYEAKGKIQVLPVNTKKVAADKEGLYQKIKEKLDRGEISQNEYIRMVNVLNFETKY